MSLNSSGESDNPGLVSFINPRDPSILRYDQRPRNAAPVCKQLFSKILEEEETTKRTLSNVKVYLRLKAETGSAPKNTTFSVLNDSTLVTNPPTESTTYKNQHSGRVVHQYSFSKIFATDATQNEIFEQCVAEQVNDFILGNNVLLFAYGTTNAGKTFTIQGNGQYPGIIPRSLDMLFKCIKGKEAFVGRFKPEKVSSVTELTEKLVAEEAEYKQRILQCNWDKPLELKYTSSVASDDSFQSATDFISSTFREMQKTLYNDSPLDAQNDSEVIYSVWVSFAEVYNECLYDLLEPMPAKGKKRVQLKMAQDSEGNVFLKDQRMIHVSSGDEAFHIMLYGKANLQVAATNMNSHSSRSHCIFTIRLVRHVNTENPEYARVSSFSFCDLAGAERVKKTLNVGERLKESNNINTSLHVLGRCLTSIRENQNRHEKRPIPFRDSKLTRLFQRALSGHESVTMIVNVNTSPVLYDETINVLKFSAIARQIVLQAPIKKASKHNERKRSRFSIMVTRPVANGTICWETASQGQSSDISVQSFEGNHNKTEELLEQIDKLTQQLKEERSSNLNLERDVRQSVTENFSKLMNEMDTKWKKRIHDIEARNQELSEWRINQVQQYYQRKLDGACKRRRISDSSVACDADETLSEEKDPRLEELQSELELLEEKNNMLTQLLAESRDIQASLTASNTALKLELAVVKQDLECSKRTVLASEHGIQGEEGVLVKELNKQLSDERKSCEEKSKNIQSLKALLDEAKEDFLLITKEKEELEVESDKLQKEIAEKDDTLQENAEKIEELQQLLAQKTRANDELEEKNETLAKAHENCDVMIAELNSSLQNSHTNSELVTELQQKLKAMTVFESPGELVETLESQLKDAQEKIVNLTDEINEIMKLKVECDEAKEVASEHEKQLLEQKSKHEQDLKQLNDEIQELQQKLQMREDELSKLSEEHRHCVDVVDAVKTKAKQEMDAEIEKCNRLESEIKQLQKDLKGTLQSNIELTKDKEVLQTEHDRLGQEIKSLLQRSLDVSSSQSEVEALTLKVKAYQESFSVIEVLKAEAERCRVEAQQSSKEVELLREKCEKLEASVKSRELELESFTAHRDKVIKSYEDLVKKAQEEVEREKRETRLLRDTLYRTPTPKKTAEMSRLKERLETSEANYNKLQAEHQELLKKAMVVSSTHNSSSDSLKENLDQRGLDSSCVNNSKRATDFEVKLPNSCTKKRQTRSTVATSSVSEENAAPQRRQRKKLFSRTDDYHLEEEEVEADSNTRSTTPQSFLKRSLRQRK